MITTIAILSGVVGLLLGVVLVMIVVQHTTEDIEQEFPTPQAPYKTEPKPRMKRSEEPTDENTFYQ